MTVKVDVLAAAPSLMKTWFGASAAINAGLDPTLAKLVKIRASQINSCANCINMHTAGARENGETEQRTCGTGAMAPGSCAPSRRRPRLVDANRSCSKLTIFKLRAFIGSLALLPSGLLTATRAGTNTSRC
jgi:AhpD family alkylhydroperoxidase